MLHFSTGILLYLAVGSVAAPPLYNRDTEDESSAQLSADASAHASDDASPAKSTAALSLESSAQSSTDGDDSDTNAASSDTTVEGSASDPNSPSLNQDDPKSPSPSKEGDDLVDYFTSLGSLPQRILYGPDSQPNITHLAAIQNVTKELGDNSTIFEAAGSILLALTKCNAKGNWIKSMFGPLGNGTAGEKTQTQNLISVQIHTLNSNDSLSKVNITIDRYNLTSVASYGVPSDSISTEAPWWPWALIEGGLQAGWVPTSNGTEEDHNVQDLLRIFSGVNVTNAVPDEDFYDKVMTNAQDTPMFVRSKGEEVYSVIMETPKNDSVLPLAGPYLRDPKDKGLTEEFLKDKLDIVKVLYLDDFLALPAIEKLHKEEAIKETKSSDQDSTEESSTNTTSDKPADKAASNKPADNESTSNKPAVDETTDNEPKDDAKAETSVASTANEPKAT